MTRAAWLVSALVVTVVLGLGCSEVLATARVPSMASNIPARPDFLQLQTMALEWMRATMTSSQFIVGTVLGVVCAEAGRFIWRWAMRAWGAAAKTIDFVVRYRLIAAGFGAGLYYALVYWVFV